MLSDSEFTDYDQTDIAASFNISFYLFIWLHLVLVAALGIFDLCCGLLGSLVAACKLLVSAYGI